MSEHYNQSKKWGVLLAFFSAISFAVMGYFAKKLSREMPSAEIIFFRGAIATVTLIPWVWGRFSLLQNSQSRFLILRAFSGAGSALCYFWTIGKTTVANARAIADISPIMVVLLGWRFLGERPSRSQFSYILVGLIGTSLLGVPGATTCPIDAWMIGLAGAIFASLSYFSLRKISKVFPTQLTVFVFMFVMALASLLWADGNWYLPSSSQTLRLAIVSITGLVAQLLMTGAYARLPAFLATALGLSTLPLAAIAEFFFDATTPSIVEIGAYLLILISVLLHARSTTMDR